MILNNLPALVMVEVKNTGFFLATLVNILTDKICRMWLYTKSCFFCNHLFVKKGKVAKILQLHLQR